MRDVQRLKRLILSLSDIGLRAGWLAGELARWPIVSAAELLNALCEESERSDPKAREALLAVSIYFAGLGECELIDRLREQAQSRHLLGLDRLLRRAPPLSTERPTEEFRVPDYGTGRELTLGERRALARRPNRRAFDKLLADPHPLVIRLLLQNPKLTEDDVVRLVARRPTRSALIHEVAQSQRWLSRSRVRLAIILNPGSPPEVAMPLLPVCKRTELREITQATETSLVLRATAHELLARRPPLRGIDRADVVLQ